MKNLKLLLGIFILFIFASTTFGQNQHTLFFDGVDDFVNCGNDASQNIQGNITLEAWVNRTGNIGEFDRIIGREWQTSYSLGSGFASNTISFGMDPKGNVSDILQSTTTIPSNIWVHVAGTWDGSMLKLYIDGELVASKAYTNASVTGSTVPTYIGKRFITSTQPSFFTGYIDEVRIWDVARTQQEIRDNMYHEIANPATVSNLVAYYQFNEGSGQSIADLSFNTNDGVLGLDSGAGSDDPAWWISTAPLPYYTISDGYWTSDATWALSQGAPVKDWADAYINNDVTINSDETASDVSVYPLARLTLSAGTTVAFTDQLMIKSDATGSGSFIPYGSYSTGSAIVERYYAGNEWHLISSPVQNAVSGMFTGLYLQSFDEASNSYSDIVPVNVPLSPGVGFAIWNNANATAEYAGIMNNGSVGTAANLSRSGAGSTNFGWNLVGNPYPSAIDWDAISGWTKTNVDNATYRHVNAATWATYVGGVGTNGGTKYIAPGQGFFVSVTDNGGPYPESGTLMLNNDVRVHNNAAFFKGETPTLVRLQISGNGYTDETVVRFNEDATTTFDNQFDAHKLFGYQAEAPQVYSFNGLDYSINTIPAAEFVNIGVKAGQSGSFTIDATEVSDFETLILEDLLTNETTNLLESAYTFDYVPETMDERFILHFSPLTGVSDNATHPVKIFAAQGNLMVNIPANQQGNVTLYSLNGQLIKTARVSGGMNTISMDKTGAFVVKVITDGFVETQKISLD